MSNQNPKEYVIKILINEDQEIIREQLIDMDKKEILYSQRNMTDLSNGTIENGLFDCYDYVEAIKIGMSLALDGYTDIIIKSKVVGKYF